jgi:hypothetical protein
VTPRSISHAQKLAVSHAQKLLHSRANELLQSHAQKLFRSAYSHARRPSRVTLGVGAATLATVGGVWGGLAATSSPAVATTAAANSAVHAPAIHAGASANASAQQSASTEQPHGAVTTAPAARATATQQAAPAHQASARPSAAATHQAAAAHTAKPTSHVTISAHSARAATVQHSAPAAQPSQPYTIYDSVTPSAIPAGQEVATYATGPFAVQASQVAGRKVLWIDTQGTDPKAAALDVEPGDATPGLAATWAQEKLSADPHTNAIIYTMQSEWPAAQAAVAGLPHWMQHHVRWWIADPTGVPHVLPGASATQWYWGSNYDITTANPGF